MVLSKATGFSSGSQGLAIILPLHSFKDPFDQGTILTKHLGQYRGGLARSGAKSPEEAQSAWGSFMCDTAMLQVEGHLEP